MAKLSNYLAWREGSNTVMEVPAISRPAGHHGAGVGPNMEAPGACSADLGAGGRTTD